MNDDADEKVYLENIVITVRLGNTRSVGRESFKNFYPIYLHF